MKYKVGDRVRINSIDWYNKNKNSNGDVVVLNKVPHFSWCEKVRTVFTKDMVKFCGKVVTIESVWSVNYSIVEGTNIDYFTDEMIEGLVEEEIKPKFKVGDKITNGEVTLTILTLSSDRYVVYIVDDTSGKYGTLDFNTQDDWKLMENELQSKFYIGDIVYSTTWQRDVVIQEILPNCFYMVCDLQGLGCFKTHEDALCKDIVKPTRLEATVEYTLPDGYIFKDENGNVIDTTKIVMEKKGKEFPKTYEECCKIMQVARPNIWFDYDDVSSISEEGDEYECHIENTLCAFRKLIICRDAYWKIAGEEMGLGKPWEPDYKKGVWYSANSSIFAFPTVKLRDTFSVNFKKEIENCKELL